jgi:hypothetical protein
MKIHLHPLPSFSFGAALAGRCFTNVRERRFRPPLADPSHNKNPRLQAHVSCLVKCVPRSLLIRSFLKTTRVRWHFSFEHPFQIFARNFRRFTSPPNSPRRLADPLLRRHLPTRSARAHSLPSGKQAVWPPNQANRRPKVQFSFGVAL